MIVVRHRKIRRRALPSAPVMTVLARGDALRQATNDLAFVQLASIRPWLRVNESTS